jgi:hypothetical protein
MPREPPAHIKMRKINKSKLTVEIRQQTFPVASPTLTEFNSVISKMSHKTSTIIF